MKPKVGDKYIRVLGGYLLVTAVYPGAVYLTRYSDKGEERYKTSKDYDEVEYNLKFSVWILQPRVALLSLRRTSVT